jgi:hypothetical protein
VGAGSVQKQLSHTSWDFRYIWLVRGTIWHVRLVRGLGVVEGNVAITSASGADDISFD